MKIVRYTRCGNSPTLAVLQGSNLYPLASLPGDDPGYNDLMNLSYRQSVQDAIDNGGLTSFGLDKVDVLAPIPKPGKIVCVGLNYRDHIEEQDEEIPEVPLLFSKSSTSVTNPGAPIVHPNGEQVDYEVELGVIIGRTARNVDRDTASDHIIGYTAVNDVSGRSAQMGDGQFFRGKSYDTFAPMGPTLVTGREFNPNSVDVECRVNGEIKQSSNTQQFVFDVYELVEYISHNMTLRPGDVISTGTPGGVGIFRDPPELLKPGDTVEIEIEGIGTLENLVVAVD